MKPRQRSRPRTWWPRSFQCWNALARRSRRCWGDGRTVGPPDRKAPRPRSDRPTVRPSRSPTGAPNSTSCSGKSWSTRGSSYAARTPPAELAGLQATLRLFGFVPDSLDLRESFADVLTEQIGGYFDPDSNTLYVPTDIDSFIVRTSVTHELVHALQGQYVNLDSLLELKHANDRQGAAPAVLEGQATPVQTLVMMPDQRLEELLSL